MPAGAFAWACHEPAFSQLFGLAISGQTMSCGKYESGRIVVTLTVYLSTFAYDFTYGFRARVRPAAGGSNCFDFSL